MGRQLIREKRMALVYKANFALYCSAWGRWVEAEKDLREYGTVITTPQGFLVQSPYLAISNRAHSQIMKALSELGISPTSQAKVTKVRAGGSVTKLEAFMGGKVD